MYKKDIIKHFGTVRKTAEAMKLSTQAVHYWSDIVPESVAYKVEVITNGALRVSGSDYEPKSKK